ncbi:MAG: hypothetical protein NXI23_22540 [Bacteroidetes bacterium]|jgi:predicted DNA binding CopG/RHH family protein|nr:hypothetical protein [Bacteroidota bacterium]MDF1863341.1 hypothetical protein [Saprospiraceae bacterium]
MAKDKTDYSKLTLGTKKPIKREEKRINDIDTVVEKIHTPEVETIKKDIPTKRITLDIPVPLHRAVRNRAYDLGIPMKQYFLELAKKDLANMD